MHVVSLLYLMLGQYIKSPEGFRNNIFSVIAVESIVCLYYKTLK